MFRLSRSRRFGGKIEDGDVVSLCTRRAPLLIQSPFPHVCTSSRHNLQRFQLGRLLITTLTSRNRKKKKKGWGGPDLTDKNAEVGIKRAEVLTRGAAKIMQIRPPHYCLSPWVANGL